MLRKIIKYWFRFTIIINILSWIIGLTNKLKENKDVVGLYYEDIDIDL